MSGLDAGGAEFRVRATGGEWSQGVSARRCPHRRRRRSPGPSPRPGRARHPSNVSAEQKQCPVCLDRGRDTAFLRRGHQTCAECAGRISPQRASRPLRLPRAVRELLRVSPRTSDLRFVGILSPSSMAGS